MKKVILTGLRQMNLIDAPEPLLVGDDEVKVKLASIGVCGSDIHYYNEGK